ncbi:hypothetical protein BC941DRAFT_475863 [Chlamydoabsidia padenii]|nr:hypothetical protein BC941DRAFT_475863 [Chlamydoabsidia padenii]
MLSTLFYFISFVFLYTSALPLKNDQQTVLQHTSSPPTTEPDLSPYVIPSTAINSYTLSNSLTHYYESIVDQSN